MPTVERAHKNIIMIEGIILRCHHEFESVLYDNEREWKTCLLLKVMRTQKVGGSRVSIALCKIGKIQVQKILVVPVCVIWKSETRFKGG